MLKNLILASGILGATATGAALVGCHHDDSGVHHPQPGSEATGQPDGGTSVSDAVSPDALTPKNTYDNRNGGGGAN